MNIKEFMKFMKDKRLLGNQLPHKTVQQLFNLYRTMMPHLRKTMMTWMLKWITMNL